MNTAELLDKPDEWCVPYLRELLAYDSLCPTCCVFSRDEHGGYVRSYDPSPLHWSRQVEWPWILKNGGFTHGHRVLDVGSGWSVLKYAVARRSGLVHCIDSDEPSLYAALPTTRLMGEMFYINNITSQLADARNIPFSDGVFDRVVCCSVLEHIPDNRDRALEEMKRVLKPGGLLLLTLDVAIDGELYGKDRPDFFVDKTEVADIFSRLQPLDTSGVSNRSVRGLSILDGKLTCVTVMIKWTKE